MRNSLQSLALLAIALAGCTDPSSAPNPGSGANPPGAQAPADGEPKVVLRTVEITPENSAVTFAGTREQAKQTGSFAKFTGKSDLDPASNRVTSLSLEIDMTSLTAEDEALTSELKSAEFFDVEQHPTAKFESTKIEHGEGGAHTITGNLTLHGQTKEITFSGKADVVNYVMVFTAEFEIDRVDFGVGSEEGKGLARPITVKLRMGKSGPG